MILDCGVDGFSFVCLMLTAATVVVVVAFAIPFFSPYLFESMPNRFALYATEWNAHIMPPYELTVYCICAELRSVNAYAHTWHFDMSVIRYTHHTIYRHMNEERAHSNWSKSINVLNESFAFDLNIHFVTEIGKFQEKFMLLQNWMRLVLAQEAKKMSNAHKK